MARFVVAVALVVGLLGVGVPATARADDAPGLTAAPDPAYCAVPLSQAAAAGVDAGLLAAGQLRLYGQVAPSLPLDLAHPPFADPSRALWYRSMSWLAPTLVTASRAGDTATVLTWAERMLDALARVPDPGSATPQALEAAFATGWDGGTNFQRMRTLVCLRSLVTGIPTLTAAVEQAAAVNLDDRRYYGPPLRPAHNHGTQANLVLLDAARLLGRSDWRAVAVSRLVRDVGIAFEPCGLNREQSLPYHVGNVELWRAVPAVLRQDGLTAQATAVERRLYRADRAIEILTNPDGRVPIIGDGGQYLRQVPGWTRPLAGLLCRETGWAARHVAGQHYVLRFGPARAMHGHADHGSIVWWDRYPVLSDPGTPGYDGSGPARWSRSNQAHSVVTVAGVPFTSGTALRAARWTPRADTYYLTDVQGRTRRARQVVVLPMDGALLVLDSVVTDRRREMVAAVAARTGLAALDGGLLDPRVAGAADHLGRPLHRAGAARGPAGDQPLDGAADGGQAGLHRGGEVAGECAASGHGAGDRSVAGRGPGRGVGPDRGHQQCPGAGGGNGRRRGGLGHRSAVREGGGGRGGATPGGATGRAALTGRAAATAPSGSAAAGQVRSGSWPASTKPHCR